MPTTKKVQMKLRFAFEENLYILSDFPKSRYIKIIGSWRGFIDVSKTRKTRGDPKRIVKFFGTINSMQVRHWQSVWLDFDLRVSKMETLVGRIYPLRLQLSSVIIQVSACYMCQKKSYFITLARWEALNCVVLLHIAKCHGCFAPFLWILSTSLLILQTERCSTCIVLLKFANCQGRFVSIWVFVWFSCWFSFSFISTIRPWKYRCPRDLIPSFVKWTIFGGLNITKNDNPTKLDEWAHLRNPFSARCQHKTPRFLNTDFLTPSFQLAKDCFPKNLKSEVNFAPWLR